MLSDQPCMLKFFKKLTAVWNWNSNKFKIIIAMVISYAKVVKLFSFLLGLLQILRIPLAALSCAVLCRFYFYFYVFWDRRSLQIQYAVFSLSMALSMCSVNVQINWLCPSTFFFARRLCEVLGSLFSETRDVAHVIRVTSDYKVRNLIW